MDMQNATAAGPSRGLLDVIFGSSKGPEEAGADGQGFESLMNFISGMNNEKKEEQSAALSRTLRETTPGKNAADSSVAGTPGKNANSDAEGQLMLAIAQEQKEQQEKLQTLSMLLGIPAQGQSAASLQPQSAPIPVVGAEVKAQEPLAAVKPEQVNAVLKQKDLQPLNQEELRLLQAVNSKLGQVQAAKSSELPKVAAAGAGVAAADQSVDPSLLKEMAKNGTDPKKLKSAELSASSVSGPQDKMVSTETYLQMHEGSKAPAKEALLKDMNAANGEAPASPSLAQGSLTSAAVAGAGAKGLALGSKKEREVELPEGAKQAAKLDAAGGPFGAALAQQSKEPTQHELDLSGIKKPDQFREVLMGEVGTGVSQHALKGGGEMRLVLNPDDMGEVKVKVSTKNGKVEVQVTAENKDVAQVIRGGSKDLEASLKEQNLSLSKFEVTVSDSTRTVTSLDNKTSLNEQFLSQNQQNQGGFGANGDDGRSSNRWDNHQGNRQGGSYASLTEENGQSSPKSANPLHRQPVRNSSRRLDISA